MTLSLVHPWAPALIPVVLAVAVWVARRGARTWVAVLSPLALALLAGALAQPELREAQRPTVLLLDRSASVDAAGRERERAWTAQAREEGCAAPCRTVAFAGSSTLLPAGAPATRVALAPGTDLEQAVRLGLARVPDGGRLVVLGDGMQTTGDVLATAAEARRHQVKVDVAPLAPTRLDAAVTRLDAPPAVRAGDPLVLQAAIRSNRAGTATITLLLDGRTAARQRVRLRAGDTPLPLAVRAPAAGWHDYELRVALPGDAVSANDRLWAAVDVQRAPRVLLASASGRSALAGRLAAGGLTVTQRAAAALPATPAAYVTADTVVLDDVSATALGTARQSALVAAVRDGGLGLVVSGGPHSFSLGRYARSPLERALPVTSRIPGRQQRRNVALELVLDRSGSMLDLGGDVPKIDEVRAAARTAAQFTARHEDELGIVTFDATPSILVPFGRVGSAAAATAIERRIDGITADGGTNIEAALAAGLKEIERSRTPYRHIILLTDGISNPADGYTELVKRLVRERIIVSAVAVGTGADQRLAGIAKATGGRYHVTADARQLPRIFAAEAARTAQPVHVEGQLAVSVGAPSPIVSSLSGQPLPPVRQNVITVRRPGAQQTLLVQGRGDREDPGLSQWQYGLGRVAAWTPGVSVAWAGTWATKDAVWQDAARWAQRPVALAALTPTVTADEPRQVVLDPAAATGRPLDLATVAGSLSGPGGGATTLRFTQTAPSRYAAPATTVTPGIHAFAVVAGDGAAPTRGLLAVPYAPEHRLAPAASSPLGQLAARTDGRVLDASRPDALGGSVVVLWTWLAAAALLVFLGGVFGRLLGGGGGRVARGLD